MESHATLTSNVVERMPEIGFSESRTMSTLTGVTADFLKKLMLVGEPQPRMLRAGSQAMGKNGNLPVKIEQDILSGEIMVKLSETGYPSFFYRFKDGGNRKRDISMTHASSAVSELAPIVLFMRHYLSMGDIFIVEEPEAHLHPAAQRVVAEVLVALVLEGVKVVVTTHSDVIQEQLSHFVHADGFPDAEVLNKKSKGRTLGREQVAAYSFARQKGERGTVIREIRFDKDTGILPPDHQDVPADLYNEFAGIVDAQGND